MFLANLSSLVLIHSYLRWVVLLLFIFLLVVCATRWYNQSRRVSIGDEKIAFWLAISFDLSFVIGAVLWVLGSKGYELISMYGMKAVMQSKAMRFTVIEHPITMLIALVLVHFAKKSLSKKHNTGFNAKTYNAYKRTFIYLVITLILVLSAIPWPWREAIGRPLF